jgi:hypothetical protein
MTDFDNVVSLNYVNNIKTQFFLGGTSHLNLDACLLSTPMWRYFSTSPNCFAVNLFRCIHKKCNSNF